LGSSCLEAVKFNSQMNQTRKTMNNRTIRLSLGAVAVGAITLLAQSSHGQVVYNTGTNFQGVFNYGTPAGAIAGNEISAGPSSGEEITSFTFQYDLLNSSGTATGTPAGGETATLQFWNNWTSPESTAVSGFRVPGQNLFAGGGAVALTGAGTPGFTTGSTLTYNLGNGLPAGGVDVPQIFTWTVTFAGIPSTEVAGLALFSTTGTGIVGGNYANAWYNANPTANPTSWNLDVASGSNPSLIFGASATAIPEPSSLGLFAMGATGLLASGWRKLRR
jgi:hypothetical protein